MCSLCKGTGNLFCIMSGKKEWWRCPACVGNGAREQFSPATIQIHKLKKYRRVE